MMVIDFHYGHGLVKLRLAWNFLRGDLRSEAGRLPTFFNLVHQEKLICYYDSYTAQRGLSIPFEED